MEENFILGGVTRSTWQSCCKGIGRRLRSRFLVVLFFQWFFIRFLLWSINPVRSEVCFLNGCFIRLLLWSINPVRTEVCFLNGCFICLSSVVVLSTNPIGAGGLMSGGGGTRTMHLIGNTTLTFR